MGDRLGAGCRYDPLVLSEPPYPDESIGDIVQRKTRSRGPWRGRGRDRISRRHGGHGEG